MIWRIQRKIFEMDKQSATSPPFPRISLPPWMNSTFHRVVQDGQACVKSMSSQLHKLGCPPSKDGEMVQAIKGSELKVLDFKAKLAKQLEAWRENREWVDTNPKIEVTVPKGTLCNLKAIVQVGLPPDAVFDIVIDPENKRVFKNIKEVTYRKVLEDDGYRQVVEVEQAAMWRFLWWSGTIAVRVYVDQDRRNHLVRFRLAKEGFMKKFEGRWTLEPVYVDEDICTTSKPSTLEEYESCSHGKGRVASLIKLEQLVQPALLPPPPISWYVRGITARTTEMLVEDLQAEVKRLREGLPPAPLDSKEEAFQMLLMFQETLFNYHKTGRLVIMVMLQSPNGRCRRGGSREASLSTKICTLRQVLNIIGAVFRREKILSFVNYAFVPTYCHFK